MKTNSFSWKKSSNKERKIPGKLATKTINKIARIYGYTKRSTGKISPKNLILGFMVMISKQRNTYSDWATEIGLLERKTITKQSLNERINPKTECFIKQVLEQQLCEKAQRVETKKTNKIFKTFNRIMIDDSTTVRLPDDLVHDFPGNVVRGEKKSQAKIHALYNLTDNNFSFLHIHSFSNNDQSLSGNSLPYLEKGDLCIRDLGFLVLGVLEKLVEKGVYFISRKNYQSKIYAAETGGEINLLKALRKKSFFDKEVLIGKDQQLKVRLIAIPLPDPQANERKRKARQDRDKRRNHGTEYYELLGYSIYITNIPSERCSAENIFRLYKLRWNIEIIFKSWKSCFSLDKVIHRQCKHVIRVKCIIYLMLLYIYLFHVVWWYNCENEMENKSALGEQQTLSILKMANFFRIHFTELITQKSNKEIIKQINSHCRYDKRKDRDNAKQFQFKIAA